jgi:hypothetical protein
MRPRRSSRGAVALASIVSLRYLPSRPTAVGPSAGALVGASRARPPQRTTLGLLGLSAVLVLSAVLALPLPAQRAHAPVALDVASRPAAALSTLGPRSPDVVTVAPPAAGRAEWWTPVASAVVPGAAQLLMRQQRGVAYLAMEGFLLFQYVTYRRDATRQRDAYREIARTQARARYGGGQPVSDFEYYETLRDTRFIESGAFDASPGGELDPETTPGTFNGFIWKTARETYFRDPEAMPDRGSAEYARAIELYERRAVREPERWSWRDAQVFRDEYTSTIRRSNTAYRNAAAYLSAVIANHALSTVDAFVTVRVRGASGEGGRLGVDASLPWAPLGRDVAERRSGGRP